MLFSNIISRNSCKPKSQKPGNIEIYIIRSYSPSYLYENKMLFYISEFRVIYSLLVSQNTIYVIHILHIHIQCTSFNMPPRFPTPHGWLTMCEQQGSKPISIVSSGWERGFQSQSSAQETIILEQPLHWLNLHVHFIPAPIIGSI